MALFIGGGIHARDPEDWPPVLIAMTVIFLSILAHELGHAFAGRRFGARPRILLHSMGGLCYLPGAVFSRGQSIVVSLAGPAAGLLLAAVTAAVFHGWAPRDPLVVYACRFSLYVNGIWTLFNLLPILPLDGGQVFRELLGPARIGIARGVGGAVAAGVALWALAGGLYILALIVGFLAFANFRGHLVEGGVVKEAAPVGRANE